MNFKRKIKFDILLFALSVIFVCALFFGVGCVQKTDYSGQTKITFELEGGTYQSCEYLIQYYDFKQNSTRKIKEPESFAKKDFVKVGYTLDGWYTTKIGENEYDNKWNFSKDTVTGSELTLYARWKKNVYLAYDVCYKEGEEVKTLGSYEVYGGAVFNDILNYASKRSGYTFIGWTNEQGEVWNENFKHPGGEKDLTVKVFAQYIEGDFAVVKTATELKTSKTRNIYLLNDIDFNGDDFTGFGDYANVFEGNGHKIYNFKLSYSASKDSLKNDIELNEEGGVLCVSLFGLTKNATIKNVTFENVSINIKTTFSMTKKIIVSPIAIKMTNSKISNVKFIGAITCNNTKTDLPKDFKLENLVIVADSAYYKKDDNSTATAELNVTKTLN